jgi:hypothetical protein
MQANVGKVQHVMDVPWMYHLALGRSSGVVVNFRWSLQQ